MYITAILKFQLIIILFFYLKLYPPLSLKTKCANNLKVVFTEYLLYNVHIISILVSNKCLLIEFMGKLNYNNYLKSKLLNFKKELLFSWCKFTLYYLLYFCYLIFFFLHLIYIILPVVKTEFDDFNIIFAGKLISLGTSNNIVKFQIAIILYSKTTKNI